MRRTIFAANWKMYHGPAAARALVEAVLGGSTPQEGRLILFIPPTVSLAAVSEAVRDRPDAAVGVQNIHWESKGAFTGETSASLALEAGATWTLVGHSERRHKFGETDDETALKARAALDAGLAPILCVGETLDQRRKGQTEAVVRRQLEAGIGGLAPASLARVAIAYEPVWAIGTGVNATPEDAAALHRMIHGWLRARLGAAATNPVLYGGSVNPENAASLLAEREIEGVLVGGASLDANNWLKVIDAGPR